MIVIVKKQWITITTGTLGNISQKNKNYFAQLRYGQENTEFHGAYQVYRG